MESLVQKFSMTAAQGQIAETIRVGVFPAGRHTRDNEEEDEAVETTG